MPVIVHAGHPRQGKTITAVSHQIIPQLAAGRRVVTNIEGMGSKERQANLWRLAEKEAGKKLDQSRFEFVPHSKLEKALIFPEDTKTETEDGIRIFTDERSLLKKGDMLVWDEARMFKTGSNMPQVWADALDYHGHWTADGFNTDLVLVTPHWDNLAPTVRGSAEVVYLFDKHAGGKACTRYFFKTPGRDAKCLPSQAIDRETIKFDWEGAGQCYATNDNPEAVAADTIVVPLWKRPHFRKGMAIASGTILAGIFAFWLVIRLFLGGDDEPAPSPTPTPTGVANRPGGTPAAGFNAFGTPPGIDTAPHVVGTIPRADGGQSAIVKVGDRFETVGIEGGAIRYKGETLPWPDAF